MEIISSLANTSVNELYTAFDAAFSDYPRRWTAAEFEYDMNRRGYTPSISFGAFDDNKLVSFTLNAAGVFNGLPTAYDTGTGTLKEYRGKSLVSKIFDTTLPFLKQAGIQQYLLEVLQVNEAAISIYKKAGFSISRSLNYFIQDVAELEIRQRNFPAAITIREIDLQYKTAMQQMWDFIPSWQNSLDSIERVSGSFKILGAFENETLAGYGIIAPASGDIPQLAVAPSYRRQGIGTAILHALQQLNIHTSTKIINTDNTCQSIRAFLEYHNIPKRGSQYEMVKEI